MTVFLQGGVWLCSDCCYSLNQLDTLDQRDLWYLETLRPLISSTLAALGTLQPRAFRFLNTVDPLVSVSNYYLVNGISSKVFSEHIPDIQCTWHMFSSYIYVSVCMPVCLCGNTFHLNELSPSHTTCKSNTLHS